MDPTARFTTLVQGPEPAIPLDQLVLFVAAHARPGLDIGRSIDRLDEIAARCDDRSFAGVFPHAPASAARAASTARSTSAGPAIAARASGSPVAGSVTSRTSPDAGSAVAPLMKSPYSRSVATAIVGEDTD